MRYEERTVAGFPKPGKALAGVMIAVSCIWVMFALGLNWGGAGSGVIEPFIVDVQKVLHGQIWRLVTAALIHDPSSPWHLLTTLLVLYFLGTWMEPRWGKKRMLAFLFGSAAFAFALQIVVGLFVSKVAQSALFGGMGMVTAVTVAWALAHRQAQVRLFFVLPVTGTMLLVFIFVMSLLYVIAPRPTPEGLITPFGGMLAGYLFGDVSPLRQWYLKLRLRRLQTQSRGGLRVVPGGRSGPPKDKRWLN
jgi:membrane associated rhomboid family serine protease